MPRIAPALLREAQRSHVLLPLLLRECRDLPSARNELRWLSEHAHECHGLSTQLTGPTSLPNSLQPSARLAVWQTLTCNVQRRARNEPLQYILGTQPFGDLEILCREGVLIPRPETEAYTLRLASILKDAQRPEAQQPLSDDNLRILDLCSGTGCISLLLHSILKPAGRSGSERVEIVGVDLSDEALTLSRENLEHNVGENLLDLSAITDVSFKKGNVFDLFSDGRQLSMFGSNTFFDIVVANPPYISEKDYRPGGTTTRSVRKFEPKLALVPEAGLVGKNSGEERPSSAHKGDTFYQPLLQIAEKVKARIIILETGDYHQALRVHRMAADMHRLDLQPVIVELWDDDAEDMELANSARHRARCVVIWIGNAARLRKRRKDSAR